MVVQILVTNTFRIRDCAERMGGCPAHKQLKLVSCSCTIWVVVHASFLQEQCLILPVLFLYLKGLRLSSVSVREFFLPVLEPQRSDHPLPAEASLAGQSPQSHIS